MKRILHPALKGLAALGYSELSLISETENFFVCRAHTPDDQSVLIRIPASVPPRASMLRQLENEFKIARELDPELVVRPLRIESRAGLTAVILEQCPYPPLADLLAAPLEIETFLRVATGIATALALIHRQGLVHKDIKPDNIFATAVGEARLTGFGVASRLSRERPAPGPPEAITGTLAYMAPEQTGRMNRSIDSRSDLYALGVTFYQMLTGRLPFAAADPMECVHCHIALQPAPPNQRVATIPEPLSDIVMKLMAKAAEDRYQTVEGLKADLEHCLRQWRTHGRIKPFPLGACDVSGRLMIPEKLYGRDREVATLLAAFDRVVDSGKPELLLVSGYSGVGKSALVNELHQALVPPRGLFTSGKYDQYKRGIPYSTLAQAFARLIRPLLGKRDAELEGWRRALQEALEPNGQLMVDLVPELKLIIGEQPPVPKLEPQQAKARFQLVFRRFIGVFARPEHPLALFLDDLQWLDAATLDVMEDLLVRQDVRHLLLIGAYRDNEVDSAHPLLRKLDAIRKAGAAVQEIALAALGLDVLMLLIADCLQCEPERGAPLARLVDGKTAGNPFFTIQFLAALAEEGLLAFDHGERRWSWDLHGIQAMGYTDNVADLMAMKMTRLPTKTQSALKQLACLGNIMVAPSLSVVLEIPEEEAHADLHEAVRQGLVQVIDGAYRFVHDRVHEAAYRLIPEASRAEAHLRIGRLLLAHTAEEKLEEAVFEIVSQLNLGAARITSRDEREELARLNLSAGKRAKATTAYEAALTYLTAGATLLAKDCWERQHELAFALEIHQAECEFLTGKLAAAEQRLAVLSEHAADTVEQAAVACLRVDLYMTLAQTSRAVAAALDYLRQLGIDWPVHPPEDAVQREFERLWTALAGRKIEALVDLPVMSDPSSLATMDVLIKLGPPALFADANLFCLTACRAVNLSLERGNSDGSCVAYEWVGQDAGPRFGNYEVGFQLGQLGYELVEQCGFKRFQARTYMILGIYVIPWTRHVREGRDLLRRAFEAANTSGDLTYAGYSCQVLITNLLFAGDTLFDVQLEAEAGLAFAQKAGLAFVADVITSQLALVHTLRGLTRKFGSFDDEHFDERRFERRLSRAPDLALPECRYWIRKQQARFTAGDYAQAIAASERAQRLLWTSRSFIEVANYHFYGALSHSACWSSAGPRQRQQHVEAVAAHGEQLQIWATHCPQNFEDRAALIGAEIARIEDRPFEAMRLYDQAVASARANGFIHNQALAHELAGRFYGGRGLEATGLAHLREARACYTLWGADGKVKQLDQTYPELAMRQTSLEAVSADASAPYLDVATVVKASQALSGQIELQKLIETLMASALENAGADRGLLILPCGEGFEVEVDAKADGAGIEAMLIRSPIAGAGCSETIVNYVIRTRKSVILDDAMRPGEFFEDLYLRRGTARSVLCLPLLRQSKLAGILYLENTHATGAFTPDRVAVLDVLAAQAAISLENARLYGDLRDSEAKYRLLVDTTNEGVWMFGPGAVTIFVNARMAEMLGYRAEEMIGRPFTDFMFDEDAPDYLRKMENRRKGQAEHYERRFRRKDGRTVWTLVSATPILSESGDYQGSFAMFTDITERKRADVELRRHKDQLEETVQQRTAELLVARDAAEAANQSKSDFLARMSHEIRTPLNAVTGLTNIVLKSELTSEQRDNLNKVQIASNNLLEVINDILDFSKVEAGRLELTHTPFDLDQVLEQLADLFSNRGAQKDIELVFAAAPRVPRQLIGDAGRLTQVLTNLVENAVKFTETGEIVVRAELDGRMDRQTGQTTLKFQVSDTGVGIAADELPTLFDPFTQADGYLTRKHEGTGLGLAICRRLVELMGGRIWAESAPGQGSTFSFTVMVETQKEEKPHVSLPADLHGLKALVVDDSAAARRMLVDMLESFTFNVAAVDSGENAILALRQESYQLVLLDWKMPGMDVVETARRIHELENHESVKNPAPMEGEPKNHHPQTQIIILVTAYGRNSVQERIGSATMADTILLKPVNASRLFNTIMELFGRKEAVVESQLQKPATRPLHRLTGRRVLVAEDSELNRDVAVALLEETGLLVETAENGRIAVDKVTGSPKGFYDAVLMDIQMPVMDGYEAARNIREFEKQQVATCKRPATQTPIIALTAHALKGEKEKCLAADMDDYLAKPLDENDLYQVLLKWVAT